MESVSPTRESKPDFKQRPVEEEEWKPNTDLGILVKLGKITIEDIAKFALRIKEPEIVDYLFGKKLKEEVLKIKSVQKQTKAGQRTRTKAVVVVGDGEGYVGIGSKTAKEATVAIKGAIAQAKCNLKPIKLGYWGTKFGEPHTVPCKATGKTGSALLRLIPAPKGSGIVAGNVPKKICQLAGVQDLFTAANGKTSTTENFAYATIKALENVSNYFLPEMWNEVCDELNPLVVYSSVLKEYKEKLIKK